MGEERENGNSVEPQPGNGSGSSVETSRKCKTSHTLWMSFAVLLSTTVIVAWFNWKRIKFLKYVEFISNVAMVAVAVKAFFSSGEFSMLGGGKLRNTLENLTIPVLAFFMNIGVFGYIIRWDHLLEDLWGWHSWWMFCAVIQILFLSGYENSDGSVSYSAVSNADNSGQGNSNQDTRQQKTSEQSTSEQSTPATDSQIKSRDVIFTILAYVVIPLIVRYLIML